MATNPSTPRRLGNRSARRTFGLSGITEIVSELRRVTWPSYEETFRLSVMVIAVSIAVGAFLGAVDLGFSSLFDIILGS
ncbi:MAG: preprotein translocase subunit SecE [Chloroflexota bacterium]|nr:preprotein translocase subunit SecE [Chloroflexota bacterium]MDE2686899.1 preprotein translocase subunit SecE [Chloroflexota bacterium]MYC07027.1 preprotein translocase subunit SecE [Chloroflexota bacterium]